MYSEVPAEQLVVKMETLSAKPLIQCSLFPRIMDKGNLLTPWFKELCYDHSSKTTCSMLTRRLLLKSIGFNAALLYSCHAVAGSLPMVKDPEIIRSQKLTSGVKFLDIIEGEGSEAHEGDLVEINYVCRRSNGYFVHSTVDQFSGESNPVILPLDDKQVIQGLKEVLIGMKAGGKRRALIPPDVGYINENLQPIPDEFGPRRSLLSHINEPLVFEVQLLKVL